MTDTLVTVAIGILGTLLAAFAAASTCLVGFQSGIRATGASKVQEILFGVILQVMPFWTSFTLYRFEANVRSASVLGIVGAGEWGVAVSELWLVSVR
ncbi:MAG: PhnE/PtxC family ABC transporter permease [Synechococcus sp.]